MAWYDASSSVKQRNGRVWSWQDKSGLANHSAQAVVERQPLFAATGLNGKPAVYFDGVDDELDALDSPTLDPETMTSVRKRREVTKDKPRSLTLFIFKGSVRSITSLQSHMHLREHDIVERYDEDELRGILTHLREIQAFEVERIFDRLKQVEGYSELKCLLVPIHSEKDLRVDVAVLVEKTIHEMAPGELKTLST